MGPQQETCTGNSHTGSPKRDTPQGKPYTGDPYRVHLTGDTTGDPLQAILYRGPPTQGTTHTGDTQHRGPHKKWTPIQGTPHIGEPLCRKPSI